MANTIKKRNGKKEAFDFNKVISAVSRAFKSCGFDDIPFDFKAKLYDNINAELGSVEAIQDKIENLLFDTDYRTVYNSFVTYRSNHALLRESKTKALFDGIINTEKNDVTRDNANMNSDSPAGMMMKFASETTKPFVDKYMLEPEIHKAVKDNIMYPHDKDYYLTRSLTCLQHPLDRILSRGFMAGHGEARPAKRIETATILAAISMETIQNEMHGGQAIPAFDFYMAPYVRMTYLEEVNKVNEIAPVYNLTLMKEAVIDDYIIKDIDWTSANTPQEKDELYKQIAINNTVKRVHQAMESFIHNMNSIHSRGGNQVVFSSINYGTDTSAEGRCVMRELLLSTEQGVGNGATAIFPIQIWKMKSGVSIDPSDRNYDLYKLSLRVSARRFFPNYLNLDSTFNHDDNWDANDPYRYEHECATMGCRTRVFENRFGPKTSIGRGNLSFTTINFVKLAIETSIEDGFLKKKGKSYAFDMTKNSYEDYNRRFESFAKKVYDYARLTAKQLDDRYQFQKEALAKQFPLLMSGMWNGSEKLKPNDKVGDLINQGTLGIGFIGLAEALVALCGHHHGEENEIGRDAQGFGLALIENLKLISYDMSELYKHNYSILGTPAEGLSGRFTVDDQKEFGKIPGVTDRDYYTNSSHVPVYYKCNASHKAEIECPYHQNELGGHIFYVEADTDVTKNPMAIDAINRMARKYNGGYISVNHVQGRCTNCNFETNDPNIKVGDVCPHCGKPTMDILERITGYLVGTTDRWNHGKHSELNDRVTHI